MGADYGTFGLNSRLQAVDSLPAKSPAGSQQYITSMEFDSRYEALSANKIVDTFKITGRGTSVVTITATPFTWHGTLTHNLGYYPSVIAYVSDPTNLINRVPVPYVDPMHMGSETPMGIYTYYYYSQPDVNTVKFSVYTMEGAPSPRSVTFSYFLLRES